MPEPIYPGRARSYLSGREGGLWPKGLLEDWPKPPKPPKPAALEDPKPPKGLLADCPKPPRPKPADAAVGVGWGALAAESTRGGKPGGVLLVRCRKGH